MAPKKKGGKKAADDWEAELGETAAPANGDAAPADAPPAEEPAEADEGDAPVSGLMAVFKKNKEKRKKKGLSENFVDGESAEPTNPEPTGFQAPQEASIEDEFALPEKKGKGGKQNKSQAAAKAPVAAVDADDLDASGRMLTKAEKERLKKEKEKQRKKEQVSTITRLA